MGWTSNARRDDRSQSMRDDEIGENEERYEEYLLNEELSKHRESIN